MQEADLTKIVPDKTDKPVFTIRLEAGTLFQFMFLVFAMYFLFFFRNTESLQTFSIIFFAIVLEALPFMLIGSLASGLIEVFVSRDRISSLMPKKPWMAVFIGAGLGLIFPVCECAVVPVVRRFLRKGVPLSAAIAYLLGGPIVNPIVGASTYIAYAFSWEVMLTRLVFGYVIAVSVAVWIGLLFSEKQVLVDGTTDHDHGSDCCHHSHSEDRFFHKLNSVIHHAAQDFYDVIRFLIIGAFVAGLLQTFISRQVVTQLAETPELSILIMMVLAMLLNLCSEADAFIAASFQSAGIAVSGQMAFMLLGPMLDIKLILMYLGLFKKKVIIALSLLTFFTVAFTQITIQMAS